MNILHGLNEKQKEAVTHETGPLLVIAGPGTGKTKVITQRIAYLIRHHGVKPERILAITFTNKAAQEMQERVSTELGAPHGGNVKVGTFHAFCVGVLRNHAEAIGLSPNFTIFEQGIQDEILIEATRELNLNRYNYPAWLLRNIIGDAKCELHNITEGLEISSDIIAKIDDPMASENIEKSLKLYQHKLSEYNALDFSDLLLKTVELFEQVPKVKADYHKNISHILVDEYHDVNRAQYRLLQLLCASPERNLTVVADEDQSIYSWRGSNPQYIEDFKADFAPETVELDQHYRCSEKILRAAEEVISNNPERQKQHTLKTHKEAGRDIFHYTFETPSEEARHLIDIIKKSVEERGYSYRDIAIFYRKHNIADVLAEKLLKKGINFQRIHPTNSFDEENSRGILSYLHFIQWQLPRDLEHVINYPEKRIDDLTWVRLKWLAKRKELELVDLLKNIEAYPQDVGPLTRRNVREFWQQFEKVSAEIKGEEINKIIPKLFDYLELSRSPYRAKEVEEIEKQPEMPNLGVVQDILYSAIDLNQHIQMTVNPGIDESCAAQIIQQTFKTYLDKNVPIHFLEPESDGKPMRDAEGVHLLIGDFNELGEKGERARTILIGTAVTEEAEITQFGAEGVRSIAALKLCQRLVSRFESPNMADMVIYDLETTGVKPKTANIVEIAAHRLSAIGNEVERYYQLVKPPGGHIPKESTRIHGIDEETVKDAPSIEMVLPEFCGFIQDRILIGHNVARFDNPILERDLQHYLKRSLPNPHYDTLVTARRLFPRQRCNLGALAEKFGIEHGRLHAALEDVEVNRKIFKELIKIDLQKREMKSLTEFLPLVGAGILAKMDALPEGKNLREVRAFLNAAKRFVRTHQSALPDNTLTGLNEQVETLIEQLAQLDILPSPEDTEWMERRSKFLNTLVQFEKIGDGHQLTDFLDYQKLLTNFDEIDGTSEQLTLMTLHAAKGTEFPIVIILGMEEGSFPMWQQDMTQEYIEEERRLFYVGMTRAQQQLYLSTTVYRTGDYERSTSMFVREVPSNYVVKWSPRRGL